MKARGVIYIDYPLDKLKGKTRLTNVNASSSLSSLRNNIAGGMSIEKKTSAIAAKIIPQSSSLISERNIELVLLIDNSGSTSGTEYETTCGLNHLIEKEKNSFYDTTITTILFNEEFNVVHNRENIKTAKPISFEANGNTALYDAIVLNFDKILNEQKNNCKTIAVISTDGLDNCSASSLRTAREMIEKCKKAGWQIVLLGKDIDSKDLARELGIDVNLAENYSSENNGILINFKAVEKLIDNMRENSSIDTDWSKEIQNNLRLTYDTSKSKILRLEGKK